MSKGVTDEELELLVWTAYASSAISIGKAAEFLDLDMSNVEKEYELWEAKEGLEISKLLKAPRFESSPKELALSALDMAFRSQVTLLFEVQRNEPDSTPLQ